MFPRGVGVVRMARAGVRGDTSSACCTGGCGGGSSLSIRGLCMEGVRRKKKKDSNRNLTARRRLYS